MMDLVIAIVVVFLISLGMLALGMTLGRRLPARDAGLLVMFTVLLMLAFEKFAADQLWVAGLLPFSNVVILGNLFPPLVGFLAGLAWRRIPGRTLRRCFLVVPLVVLSWAGTGRLLLRSSPPLGNRWTSRGICRQTSNASCSAAAAATFLYACGIRSTEPEMADLCLTRSDGTTMLGLYRGLKLKTAGTGWKLVPIADQSIDDLRQMTGPILLSVELLPGEPLAARYQQWGWGVGSPHSVVLFRFLPNNQIDIGDPDTGRERWSLEDLEVLWHGAGIRAVRN